MTETYYVLEIRHQDGRTESHRVDAEVRVLGRSKKRADIKVPDKKVSGRHCEIRFREGRVTVLDLGSTNGTVFNGTKRREAFELKTGASFIMGDSTIRLLAVHGFEEAPKTQVVEQLLWGEESSESTRALDAAEINRLTAGQPPPPPPQPPPLPPAARASRASLPVVPPPPPPKPPTPAALPSPPPPPPPSRPTANRPRNRPTHATQPAPPDWRPPVVPPAAAPPQRAAPPPVQPEPYLGVPPQQRPVGPGPGGRAPWPTQNRPGARPPARQSPEPIGPVAPRRAPPAAAIQPPRQASSMYTASRRFETRPGVATLKAVFKYLIIASGLAGVTLGVVLHVWEWEPYGVAALVACGVPVLMGLVGALGLRAFPRWAGLVCFLAFELTWMMTNVPELQLIMFVATFGMALSVFTMVSPDRRWP